MPSSCQLARANAQSDGKRRAQKIQVYGRVRYKEKILIKPGFVENFRFFPPPRQKGRDKIPVFFFTRDRATLHELMDFIVPKQWGLTDKTIILINSDHYWDYLLLQFKTMVEKNALKQKHLDLLIVAKDIESCIKAIQHQDTSPSHQGLKERYWDKETQD